MNLNPLEYRKSLPTSDAQRAFILLMIMAAAFGMALSVQDNIVTNYFENELGNGYIHP